MVIHCINVLWGEEFTRTFLTLSLPTQLAPGNLSSLGGRYVYRIFTTAQDRAVIQSSEIFSLLEQVIVVEFIEIRSLKEGESQIELMTSCHAQAVKDAAKIGAALIFLSPDILLSRDSFKRIGKAIEENKRALVVLSLRLSKECFEATCKKLNLQSLSFSARELVKVALSCLHPLSKSLFWSGNSIASWPSHLYWKLDDGSLLARGFHLHPLYLLPENYEAPLINSIDANYLISICPSVDRWEIVQDSDEMAVFEVTSLYSDRHYPVRYPRLKSLVKVWMGRHVTFFQAEFVKKKIYIHSSDYLPSWDGTIAISDRVIDSIVNRSKWSVFFANFIYKTLQILNKILKALKRCLSKF